MHTGVHLRNSFAMWSLYLPVEGNAQIAVLTCDTCQQIVDGETKTNLDEVSKYVVFVKSVRRRITAETMLTFRTVVLHR